MALLGLLLWAQIAFSSDDTLQAIQNASEATGVSVARLERIVGCETGWTFNPYAVGRQGELGAVQLHPRGELARFYAVGYSDPFDPYESVSYLAEAILEGRASRWSCR